MKKSVNGTVVDIANIELFELGAEGIALSKTALSRTSVGVPPELDGPLLSKLLENYNLFLKIMPYPLYSIEEDIKYATMALFIKEKTDEDITLWVRNGLFILLERERGMCLHIVNNTWGIVSVGDNIMPDNSELERFSGCVGYNEYKWILENADNIINKKASSNFYKVFMPELLQACKGNPMVIKWELKNILEFGYIPEREEYETEKIKDIDSGDEYHMDIYIKGVTESRLPKDTTQCWNLDTGKNNRKAKNINIYGYDLYKKSDRNGSNGKMQKVEIPGVRNLFLELIGIKNANESHDTPEYKAIIAGTYLLFEINGEVFKCKSNRESEATKIAKGASIIGCERGMVYLLKKRAVTDKVTEHKVYAHNLKDGSLRICSIRFVY